MPPTATSGGPAGGDAFLEKRPRGPWGGERSACALWSVWPPRGPWPWVADRAPAFRRTRLGAGLDLLPWLGLDHPISLAAPTAVS